MEGEKMVKKIILLFVFIIFLVLAGCGKTVNITFESNGGSEVSNITDSNEFNLDDLPTSIKEGYSFIGWFVDEELTKPISVESNVPKDMVFTLYAKWEVNSYTITFNSNGGSSVEDIIVEYGGNVTTSVPIKEGYIFNGWYLDDTFTKPVNFSTMTTCNDLTFYAKWDDITYIVNFDTNGGTAIDDIVVGYGNKIVMPANPTKDGYTFIEWCTEIELENVFDSDIIIEDDQTLYAKWDINDYTLDFDSLGGSSVESITDDFGSSIIEPISYKIGHTFIGWYTESELTNKFTFDTMPSSNLTLYANWQLNDYTIIFDSNDGSEIPDLTAGYNTNISAPENPTLTGYSFLGWFSDSDLTEAFEFTVMPLDGATIYAKWKINQYTITFISYAEITVTSITADYNKIINAPEAPIREGYTFLNWYSDEEYNNIYVFDRMPDENFTLYAKWFAGDATITFNSNGGSVVDSITAQISSIIIEPVSPTKDGFVFKGWYTNVQLTDKYESWIMPVGGITLYGKWGFAEYTLTFDSVGGSVIDPISREYLTPITSPLDPIKEGYLFDGWYTDTTYSTIFTFDFMPNANTTIYASWIDPSGEMLISNVKTKTELTSVIIVGTVISKLSNDYLGFYISDVSGQILVNYNQDLVNIGDNVTVKGIYELWNDIPTISNITEMNINSQNNIMPLSVDISISQVTEISNENKNNYGKYITTEGILVSDKGFYYLFDTLGNNIKISHRSYSVLSGDLLADFVNNYVSIDLILYEYDNDNNLWVASYVNGTINVINKTDEDKVSMINEMITNQYNNRIYRPLDEFSLPSKDLFEWSTITFQAVGNNAQHYDSINHIFLIIENKLTINFEVTVTINDANSTFTIDIILDNSISTIAEFINGDEDTIYSIIGIVILKTEELDIVIISDGTSSIFVEYNLSIGDEVKVTAKKSHDGHLVYIDNNQDTQIEFLSSGNHVNLPSVVEIELIDDIITSDSTIYGKYIEIRGFLNHYGYEQYTLTKDGKQVVINTSNYSNYEMLQEYVGIEIILRGYIIPGDDGWELLFLGFRDEFKIPEYTDEELVNILQEIFINEHSSKKFIPYEKFNLMSFHPYLGGEISWSYSESTNLLIDPETNAFINVDEIKPVQIDIVIQKNQARLEFTFNTTLEPFGAIETSDLTYLVSNTMVYIHGTVVYHNFDYTYVQMSGGLVRIDGNIPAFKGDEIIVKGYTYFSEGEYNVYIDSEDTYFHVISRYNNYQSYAEEMTTDEISLENTNNKSFFNRYVQVSGQLSVVNYDIYLNNGTSKVLIEPGDGYTYERLVEFNEREVTLKAYVQGKDIYGDNETWVLYYTGLDEEFEFITYSDSETLEKIKNYVIDKYQNTWYEGYTCLVFDQTHPYLGGSISYLAKGDNAIYLEIENEDINEVTEKTEVDVEITIIVGSASETFDIIFTIVPYLTSTTVVVSIEEFKNSNGEELTVCGNIISIGTNYFLIEDDTGRIFVNSDVYRYNSDLGKKVEVTGKLTSCRGRLEVGKDNVINIIAQNQVTIIDYPEVFLSEILKADPYNQSVYGKSLVVKGTLIVERDEYYNISLYITNGYDKIKIESIPYSNYSLSIYDGFNVEVKGFIYGRKVNSTEDVWCINFFNNSIKLDGYTVEENIDFVGNEIISKYDGLYLNSGSRINLLTSHQVILNTNIIYEAINDTNNIIDFNTGLISIVNEDTEITVKATISLDGVTKEYLFTIIIKGLTLNSLSELLSSGGVPYDEVAILAQLYFQSYGTRYFLIDGIVYVINYNYYYYNGLEEGDQVYISGVKTVIDGKGGFGYDIDISLPLSNSREYNLESHSISLAQVYQTDLEIYDLTQKYLEVYGQILYDHIMEMYYLKDGDHIVYIRSDEMEMSAFSSDSSYQHSFFYDYLYSYVTIKVLFPNLKVRGNIFLVDYKHTVDSIIFPELTAQERVNATKDKLIALYNGKTFYCGDYLWIDNYDNINNTEILWNTSDLFIDNTFGWVEFSQQVIVSATITYDDGVSYATTDVQITFVLEPVEISSIIDVLRGLEGERYFIQGIVQQFDYNWNWWVYVKDDTGIILVELYQDGLEVGDEVIIYGTYGYYNYDTTPALTSRPEIIEVVSKGNHVSSVSKIMTFEEIEKLDYMYPEVNGQLITVSGVVRRINYYDYVLDNNGLELNIMYTWTDDYNGKTVLDSLLGQEIELTGYLFGLETIYSDSNWQVTFTGDPLTYTIIQ